MKTDETHDVVIVGAGAGGAAAAWALASQGVRVLVLEAGPRFDPALDYRIAFVLAPFGLVLSRQRLVVDVNREALAMFATTREALVGRSFELLYPTPEEFERTGLRIAACLVAAVASLLRGGKYHHVEAATSPAGAPTGLEPVEEVA